METITKNIPALALRGLTVFPRMTASFDVEREISVRALERAMETGQEIFLVTQRELGVELLLEGGLTGVGFRIRLLPGGILNSLDLLVDSIKTAFDAVHVIARNVADLVPFLLNGGQCLASLLGGLLILDRHQSLSLGQQFFLLGEIFLFGRANLLAIGLTGVEERVRRSTETCPQRVIITTARTTGLLPTIHQLVELAGGFHPSGGILDLLGFGGLAGVLFSLAHQHANLLGKLVAVGAQGVTLANGGAVLGIQIDDLVYQRQLCILKLLFDVFLNGVRVLADKFDIQHD